MKTIPVVTQTDTAFGKGDGPVYCFREVAMDGDNVIPAAVSHPNAERFFGVYKWVDTKNKWEWVADVATRELATQLSQTLAGTTEKYIPSAMAVTFAQLAIGYHIAHINADHTKQMSTSWDDMLQELLWHARKVEKAFFDIYLPTNQNPEIVARYGDFVSRFGRDFICELLQPAGEEYMHRTDVANKLLNKAWESIQ